MRDFLRHELPHRNANGSVSCYCRGCGREVARSAQLRIRSIAQCAYCVLLAQGVTNPEDYVLPQYIMTDPTKPPVPLDAESEDGTFLLFPEERMEKAPMSGGIIGTAKGIFRALGFGKQEDQGPAPQSRQIAVRRRRGSLRD